MKMMSATIVKATFGTRLIGLKLKRNNNGGEIVQKVEVILFGGGVRLVVRRH